jgi:hypothetical protein
MLEHAIRFHFVQRCFKKALFFQFVVIVVVASSCSKLLGLYKVSVKYTIYAKLAIYLFVQEFEICSTLILHILYLFSLIVPILFFFPLIIIIFFVIFITRKLEIVFLLRLFAIYLILVMAHFGESRHIRTFEGGWESLKQANYALEQTWPALLHTDWHILAL